MRLHVPLLFSFQPPVTNQTSLTAIDWTHLSNIVSAYETYCIKTYISERAKMLFPKTPPGERTIEDYAALPMSATISLSTFVKSLPTFQSLPRPAQKVLCESNLRRLISMNLFELNHSCFSEPSQVKSFAQSVILPYSLRTSRLLIIEPVGNLSVDLNYSDNFSISMV